MANLSQKDLQFCFDELLGELGWGDEVAETGVDPLAWERNEIKDLHKTIKRLRGSLELRNAAEHRVQSDNCPRGGSHNWQPMALHNVTWETCIKCGNCR